MLLETAAWTYGCPRPPTALVGATQQRVACHICPLPCSISSCVFCRLLLFLPLTLSHTTTTDWKQVWDTAKNKLHSAHPADLKDPVSSITWENAAVVSVHTPLPSLPFPTSFFHVKKKSQECTSRYICCHAFNLWYQRQHMSKLHYLHVMAFSWSVPRLELVSTLHESSIIISMAVLRKCFRAQSEE